MPLWTDLDRDEDRKSLIQSKSQRRSSSEVDMSRKERYALKIEDKVSLEACSFELKVSQEIDFGHLNYALKGIHDCKFRCGSLARSSYPCSLEPRDAQKPWNLDPAVKSAVPTKMMEIQGEQRKRRNFEAFELKQKLERKNRRNLEDRENAVVRTACHNRT